MPNFTRKLASMTLATIMLTAAPAQAWGNESPKRPNLVVFLADDLSYGDVSVNGDPNVRTPALDRLAAEGMSFQRTFVASPACAPSRAALLTGLMPARNGAKANQQQARASVRKLPSYLQDLGYQVVAIGKVSHYGDVQAYGFDYTAHFGYHDDQAIPAAVEWLKARKDDRPLALFVGTNFPHVPWPKTGEGYKPGSLRLPPKTVDTPITRDARARFYAAVTRMDNDLAATMDAVDRVLGKDTFFLYSTDHGTQWPFGKWNLYDTGTRVPMIVRWGGHVKAGSRSDAMLSWVDILPTLVQVAGGTPSKDIDGRSFSSLLGVGNQSAGRSEIYTTHNNDGRVNVYPMRSVRTDRWKYIRNLHPDWTYTTHIDIKNKRPAGGYFPSWRTAAERDAKAKAIVDAYYTRPAEELYDLHADPDEKVNLAADPRYAAELAELRAKVEAWSKQQGDTGKVPVTPRRERGPLNGEKDGRRTRR